MGSFVDDSRLVPNGFTQLSTETLTLEARTGIKPMHEINDYWLIEDNNLLALNSFLGVGYSKLVSVATTVNGFLPAGDLGGFSFTVAQPVVHVHQETGYIVAYTDV